MVIQEAQASVSLIAKKSLSSVGRSKHWAQVQDRPRYKRDAVERRRRNNRIARASRKAGARS